MYNPNLPTPRLGLYENLPDADYRSLNAVSTSEVSALDTTLAHWKNSLSAPRGDSEALRVGNAVDYLIQGSETFYKNMAVLGDDVNLRTNAGRDLKNALLADFGKNNVLKPSEFNRAQKAVDALKANPETAKYLNGVIMWQPSFVWTDIGTGLPRRCRWDALTEVDGKRYILDIKTVRTGYATHGHWMNHAYAYGYHRQAFAYLEAARCCGIIVHGFKNIIVDSDYPFCPCVRQPDDDLLQIAAKELDERMKQIAVAVTTNYYPGYDGECTYSAPRWVKEKWDGIEGPMAAGLLSPYAQELMDGGE